MSSESDSPDSDVTTGSQTPITARLVCPLLLYKSKIRHESLPLK